jgi:hypothetical protein
MVWSTEIVPADKAALMLTVTEAVAEQVVVEFVPVTIYVVVLVGDAVTTAVFAPDNPVDGVQL